MWFKFFNKDMVLVVLWSLSLFSKSSDQIMFLSLMVATE